MNVLEQQGVEILAAYRGMPLIKARIPAAMLMAETLHGADIIQIEPANDEAHVDLLGYAGGASMLPNELIGGGCGSVPCDGGLIDVGLWERDSADFISGLARNNARISAGTVTGYLAAPKSCVSDTDCSSLDTSAYRKCQAPTTGAGKICVQDHLSWVAASVGMYGSYNYSTADSIMVRA